MEEMNSMKTTEKMLDELIKSLSSMFEKIGTNKSRQRLVYDLLNILKAKDYESFMNVLLKQINTASFDDNLYFKDRNKVLNILMDLYNKFAYSYEFERVGYVVVMSIMKTIKEDRGDVEWIKSIQICRRR